MPAASPGTGFNLHRVHSRTDKNQQNPQEKCQCDIAHSFKCHLDITAIKFTEEHLLIIPQRLI